MKRLALIVATIATIGLLWGAGELHRQNCIRDGRTSCSILPWESGRVVLGPPSLNGSTGYLLPTHYALP